MRRFSLVLMIITLFAFGCSGGGTDVSAPDTENRINDSAPASHSLWGLWQGVIDPGAQTIEFTELRTGDFHLNALPFLEPPPLLNLTLETLQFNGDIIEADIGLRHPFLGLTEFTGFDVSGIFITSGSIGGFDDTGLLMPGEADTRLLNPDGYSRWWNPAEFPSNGTIFGYTDGLLGAPDSYADFSATLNGYKYFCDDLDDPDDPLSDVTVDGRGMFSAGQKNVRHYTIQMAGGLIFNYAVDASWMFPQGDPPYQAPDDFAPEANRVEAWTTTVTELDNTLWNDGIDSGGDLSLAVSVYDWYGAGLNTVRVESPGNFGLVETSLPTGSGEGYSTYQIDITDATPAMDEIDLLISVVSEEVDFGGFIAGTNTTAYFTHASPVTDEPFLGFSLILDENYAFNSSDQDCAASVIYHPTSGYVYVSYMRWYPPSSGTSDYQYSPDSGVNWIEPAWSTYGVGGPLRPFSTYMGIDANGDVYQVTHSIESNTWSAICKFIPQPGGGNYNNGVYPARAVHGNSLRFTHDGYPIAFGDNPNYINYKRGTDPNVPHVPNNWPGWDSIPEQTAVSAPARLSHTRNNVLDPSYMIHLIYFSSDNDTWIRIASNDEAVIASNWTTDEIYNGNSDGYDIARDPTIWLESDGDWHAAFICHDSTPNEYILYMRSTDGINWSNPVVAYQIAGENLLDDPTVDVVEVNGQEIVLITFENNDSIYIVYTWNEGATWQAPTLMSTGDDEYPDTCSSADGYIHTVWEHNEATDSQIEYIRAHFEEM